MKINKIFDYGQTLFWERVARLSSQVIFRLSTLNRIDEPTALKMFYESDFYEELEDETTDMVEMSDFIAYKSICEELGLPCISDASPIWSECSQYVLYSCYVIEAIKMFLLPESKTEPSGFSIAELFFEEGFFQRIAIAMPLIAESREAPVDYARILALEIRTSAYYNDSAFLTRRSMPRNIEINPSSPFFFPEEVCL